MTADQPTPPVVARHVSKSFRRDGGELVAALSDIDLHVESGEIVVLLGPSGCGKTTLLRCIGGLEEPTAGTIAIGGDIVFDRSSKVDVPPNRRDVNMMFQSYALWPHMTLEANVAYPLRVAGLDRRQARSRANEYLQLVGLDGLGKQYAGNISGGQQQRVALARTLVSEPTVVLFDEPLSNVDAKVRAQLRGELVRLHTELQFAAVYVTHDQSEAMSLGTRVAVMRSGSIDQVAPPVEIYHRPTTEYVAQFLGAANLLEARLVARPSGDSDVVVDCSLGELVVDAGEAVDGRATSDERRGFAHDVCLMVRPEACSIALASQAAPPGQNSWKAIVESAVFAGSHTEYTCRIGSHSLIVWRSGVDIIPVGSEVVVHVPRDAVRVISG